MFLFCPLVSNWLEDVLTRAETIWQKINHGDKIMQATYNLRLVVLSVISQHASYTAGNKSDK